MPQPGRRRLFQRLMRAILVVAALGPALPALAQSGPALGTGWTIYQNARFGTFLRYPRSHFRLTETEPANADGRTFASPDGTAQMRVWAGYNALGQSLAEIAASATEGRPAEALAPHLAGDDWFSLGFRDGATITRRHAILDAGDVLHNVLIRYPAAEAERFGPVAEAIAASLAVPRTTSPPQVQGPPGKDLSAVKKGGLAAPAPAPPPPQPVWEPYGPVLTGSVDSTAAVENGPTQPSVFEIDAPMLVQSIMTYHWNHGRGDATGTIGLVDAAGELVGRWAAEGKPGQGGVPDAYWYVYPGLVIPAGRYEIVDGKPETWATNAQTGDRGIFRIEVQRVRDISDPR